MKIQDEFEDRMDALAREIRGAWFDAKVAGVTMSNAAGRSRQEIAREVREHDELELRPEPENQWDPNAIAVWTADGEQLGYLDARLAAEVTRRVRKGAPMPRAIVRALRQRNEICGVSFALLCSYK